MGEAPCRYRVIRFERGSRKYNAIVHEIKLRPRKSRPLPRCDIYRIRIYQDGSGAVTACHYYMQVRAGHPTHRMFGWDWVFDPGFWSTAWKVAKCGAVLIATAVPMLRAYREIEALGGVREAAKLIVGAGSWADLRSAAPNLAAQITGIDAIAHACF